MTDKNLTLEKYGPDFQWKAAKALIEDQNLFKSLYKIIEQNAFTDILLRQIVGTEKDLYSKNKVVPSYYEIELSLRLKEKDENNLQYIEESIQKLKSLPSNGEYFTKERLKNFFIYSYILVYMRRTLEKMETMGDYDERTYKDFVKQCDIVTSPSEKSSKFEYTEDNAMRVLTEGDEEVVPTGIKEIDNLLAGGIGRTEIALFTALTGYGKTTFGSVIAYNAAMLGYKVLQIYFEDKETSMMRKEFSMLYNNAKINNFKGMEESDARKYAEELKKRWENLEKNHKFLKMPNKSTTVEDIEEEIEWHINDYNFRPDLIVIDYFSCLKFSRNAYKDPWMAQADCMRKIQAMAEKYRLAVWVLQQNNRPSPEKTPGMGNWQGAYEATQTASAWIELQRTPEQKQNGRADLIFNKTRNSQPKNDLLDIVFDNSRMLIDCSQTIQNDEDLEYKE